MAGGMGGDVSTPQRRNVAEPRELESNLPGVEADELEERFYSTGQAGAILGYSRRRITDMINEGYIRAIRPLGGQWRIPESEIKRMQGQRNGRTRVVPADPLEVKDIEIPEDIAGKVFPSPKADPQPAKARPKGFFPINFWG